MIGEQETGLPPVAELVPHRGRMMLIDELVAAGPGFVRCRVVIRPDSAFLEEGRVPAIVAIEYMAQGAAVFAGLQARGRGEPVRIGYLLGTRELVLDCDGFLPGDELLVEVRHQFGDDVVGAFECTVRRREQVVATALLNVYQGEGKDAPG